MQVSVGNVENLEDAVRDLNSIAEQLDAAYVTAGHIFATDCKKGVPPRGIPFLQEICSQASVPVYAIGGISAGNLPEIRQNGATGACIMSGAMQL